MSTLMVLGGTSDIARAVALVFAQNGWSIQLIGRDQDKLQKVTDDISIRVGIKCVSYCVFDVLKDDHEIFWNSLTNKPDGVLCAIGLMLDQEQSQYDWSIAETILNSNFFKLVPILNISASFFENQGCGLIIGISSVAGDRGRAANYTYGAAKAAFTAYLSGLRNRLYSKGVRVITVKPGYVRTSMTEGLDLPARLTSTPEQVANDIWRAVKKKKDVVYTKWMWRWIMFVIKAIPEFIFKRMNI
jgi:short-subunit dehydrogenase